MKRNLILLGAIMIALCSCNKLAEQTSAYKQVAYERDSIKAAQEKTIAELDDYISIIQDVDSGFAQIRESENYINIKAGTDGMPSNEVKQRMADNFYTINTILAENKAKIEELEKKVQNGNIQSAQLKKSIAKLTAQLEQKSAEIEELQQTLTRKNIQIDSLMVENRLMEEQARLLADEMERQSRTIEEQDKDLHRGYFMLADKKTLRDNNIDAKKMSSSFRSSLFTAIDIRDVEMIPTHSKSAKIITKHPATSYVLERDENRQYVLVIKNATDFWSVSKYLIIKVD
ncbi:MAG: hypothetical protein MJ003_07005 [Paludibacteraceae bacterium]|nr:hypothetical protein [Paludibacteraceae bacterium]